MLSSQPPCRAAHEGEHAAAIESLRCEARARLLSALALLHRARLSHESDLFRSNHRAMTKMPTG